jgi:hypothetical protein
VAAPREVQAALSLSAPQLASTGPWFRGKYFVSGRARSCAVCGGRIDLGQSAIANMELRQCAHLGCGTIEHRRPR